MQEKNILMVNKKKCDDKTCWCNTLKHKELEEAFEAYERSER